MVGTRELHRLLTQTHAVGGKLVLVGDPAQLPEIETGGLFAALAARAMPLQLNTNRRQQQRWEAHALLDLRDGRIDSALDANVSHERVHVLPDVDATRGRIARDYTRRIDRGSAPGDVVVLASTRDDVAALNHAIRGQLRRSGRLGADRVTVGNDERERSYAPGDLVLVTRNDHSLGLLNGTRPTLTRVGGDELTLRTSYGGETTVPASWAVEHLDHGYAMTVHKASPAPPRSFTAPRRYASKPATSRCPAASPTTTSTPPIRSLRRSCLACTSTTNPPGSGCSP